jgi:hypothetical protein
MAIDEEYPILEYLILASTTSHLRSLAPIVFGFLQMISLLTTAVGPRHTLSYHGPSIHLLTANCSSPMTFIRAPTGDAPDPFFIPCSQPWRRGTSYTYSHHDTRYTS